LRAFLRGGRDEIAALLPAASTVEPHLGSPVCSAVFISLPRTRLPLARAVVTLSAGAFERDREFRQRC
jgi:hypothetical protein